LRKDARTALAALRQAMGAAPSNTDSVYSGLALTEGIQVVTIERILPTALWIEDDIFGDRHVMLQHEGCDAFCYASSHYDYRYTDNAGTWTAAHKMALALGATEPVEHRMRDLGPEWGALGETARSNEKPPASGSSTAVSGEEATGAARYRFLRERAVRFEAADGGLAESPWCVIGTCYEDCFPCEGDRLDAAIDAAMQASNGLAAPSGSGSEGDGVVSGDGRKTE
jgi:hypothetical protein